MAAPPPQAIPDDLVEEILLLLPPDEPAWLLRASLVCKTWRGIVSHRVFRRRLHELHGAPPVLGFLHNWDDELIPRFIPTTASSLSLAAPRRHLWRAIDCRHGRALFISDPEDDGAQELLLWEPITGFRQRVPVPEAYERTIFQPSAAVLCAADGCGHRDCLGGPFCLVFVFSVEDLDRRGGEALRAEQHHDLLPPLNITEEVGGEEEDKNLQWARKLFDKWCKDIEEGGFGNTTDFSSHTLEFRVPLPPERASTFYRCGRAFLHKARKATNHSRNGSKSSSNEESIRSTATASKDDTEVSEVFGSNVEQAPAENVDSEGKNLNGKDQEDGNAAGGGDDSDLDMAWKMLNVARAIVTKNPGMTMEKFNIFLALAEVCKKRGDWDNTIGYYFKAFAILEHLVRPDNIRIVDINARICVAFELASKVGDAIPYCEKSISVCKSRIQNLKNAKEDLLADNDVYTSAAEGSSGNRSPEDEISFLTAVLARLQKKLKALEQAMSTPSPGVDRTMKRVVSMASQEQNVKNTVARAPALTSSQMAGSNHSFHSPTMSIAATGGIGSGVTYFGIFGTAMKQLMKTSAKLICTRE
ncbi:hypothetical protein ZWY2020_018942 [Hordeum vulgare]|nr:hypothetical protein ZWY2020_018942 [Hordeum vulgare]